MSLESVKNFFQENNSIREKRKLQNSKCVKLYAGNTV